MTWKQWGIRALWDAGVLVVAGTIVMLALFAYHGQQAYVTLNTILAAQQQQASAQQRAPRPPEPTK